MMLIPMLLTLIALAVLGVLMYPLLGPPETWDFDQAEGFLTTLTLRRDRILRALKDIEFERDAGGLSDEEYYPLRQDLKRRAIRAMKELDRVRASRMRNLHRSHAAVSPSLARQVEALVAKRKEAR